MLEEIRALLRETPFRPFTVFIADGRNLHVPHPDFAHVPKPGFFFFFHDSDNYGELVSALLITSVAFAPLEQTA